MGFKICVVGCGEMALHEHGPSYRKYKMLHTDVELAACCDIDRSKAEFYKQEFGFSRYYTDMDLMLDSEKPQAVCLIVPVGFTAGLSVRILEKGYPLIMEKPPGINMEETINMIRAAKQNNTPNQVAFNRRYVPLVNRLKDLLLEHHAMDKTMNIHYKMLRVGRKDSDFSTTAIHGIDLVKNIAASDYKTVRFQYQELSEIGVNVVNIYMDCEFESGAHAGLSFCPVTGMNVERLEVNSYDHTFQLNIPIYGSNDFPGMLMHFEKNKLLVELSGKDVSESEELYVLNGFYDENRVFFDAIRNGEKPKGDIASCLQSVEIADCIRKRLQVYKSI